MVAGITVDGNSLSGVFYIYPYLGDQVIIDSLTVTGGAADGGAGIETGRADLVLQEVTVTGNVATDDGGGILLRSGELTLTDSTISGNTAEDNGGGLYVQPYSENGVYGVTITDSEVIDNTAARYENEYPYQAFFGIGGGAAIRGVDGDVTITGTTVAGNVAGFGGGLAISAISGQVVIDASTISDNYARKYNQGPSGIGGGIALDGSDDVTISDSTITGNIAQFSGGGVFVKYSEDIRALGDEGDVEALAVTYDPVDIVDTVISGNGAFIGGNVSAVQAEVRLVNSQVSGNIAEEGFGSFFGGGVALKYSDLDLIDSEVVGNTAFIGGGIAVKYGSNLGTERLHDRGEHRQVRGRRARFRRRPSSSSCRARSRATGPWSKTGAVPASGGGIALTRTPTWRW